MKRQFIFLTVVILLLVYPLQSQDSRRIAVNKNERRTALVIGNNNYSTGKLANAVNDARAMSGALKELGFSLDYLENVSLKEMTLAVQEFQKKLRTGGIGLFYFAGHGIQIDGLNYLIPIGSNIKDRVDVQFESLPADRVIATMGEAGNRLNIVILDACRDNPFRSFSRSAASGLAQMQSGKGMIIAYATSPGETASDGVGTKNGLFTYHLLNAMKTPGLRIEDVFKQAREGVNNSSNGKQLPWTSTSIIGDFIFNITGLGESEVAEDYRPTLPPATGDVDLSDLKAESERTRLAKQKELDAWSSWQGKFKQTIEEAKKLDGDSNISASSKKTSWDRILKTYNSDNPYSADDENLRKYVKERINYWTKESSKPAPSSSGSYYSSGDSSDSKYYNMARIPAGSFEMGSNDGSDDEKPVHTVQLSSFYMDKYEVTNGEYKKCVDAGSCRAPSESKSYTRSSYYGDSRYENYPVIYVSWDDARKYCQWKGKRLPTEAEWEYAARGGLSGARYPNGDNINCGDANFARWGGSGDDSKCRDSGGKDNDTHPVGSYVANGYGLYDMAGNVWEWTNDWYDGKYYENRISQDPQGPDSGNSRVVRGGSWGNDSDYIRVSDRGGGDPTVRSVSFGFRCAR